MPVEMAAVSYTHLMVTVIPILVTFSIFAGIIGAFCTCWFAGVMNAVDLEYGLPYMFVEWFIWAGIIKSLFFAFIIASVSAFFGYTVAVSYTHLRAFELSFQTDGMVWVPCDRCLDDMELPISSSDKLMVKFCLLYTSRCV